MSLPVSILNLVPIRQGSNAQDAITDMVHLLEAAENFGYLRYWIAEHHNMPNFVSSATVLLIQHALAHSSKIKVGSGGIMLPNHSPLVVAEQFGTLATIYPHRVELGLGRAPGTDMRTAAALRRSSHDTSFSFPNDIAILQGYFDDADKQGEVVAYPAVGTQIPLYILGSSTDSAHLAAKMGLPYVFATHFAPQQVELACKIYREEFRASNVLDKPYFMVCLNVTVADTDEEAKFLETSSLLMKLGIIRNNRRHLSPPVENMEDYWLAVESQRVLAMHAGSLCGSEQTVTQQLSEWKNWLGFDEVMAVSYIFNQDKQIDSFRRFKILAERI